jgi:F-type H+-transporting ATPase subunit delta
MPRRPTTAARRYAEAAFELAERDGTLDAWLAALTAAAEALTLETALRIVDNPAIPLRERQAAVEAILEGRAFESLLGRAIEQLPAPEVDPTTVRRQVAERVGRQLTNLVGLLVERRRVALLPKVADAFRRLIYARRNIVEAEVASAAPLTEAERAALRERLARLVGRRVELRERLDPGLLGGLVVRIGDRLYDASVRGRLERLRNRLIAGSRGWTAGTAPESAS